MPLNNPSAEVEIQSGTYTGNDSAARGIPHGLLKAAPKLVIIVDYSNSNRWWLLVKGPNTYLYSVTGGSIAGKAVAAPDATNFYVGIAGDYPASANNTGVSYNWVAMT